MRRLKVLSVKPKGTRQTYNLHMQSKYHNFVLGNGIVSGNSHSAAYSIIAYWTAWLKVYYPLEYMAAVLTYEIDDTESLFKYTNEAKRMGIEFLPPDINKSKSSFSIEDNKIRYGFAALETVGGDTGQEIVEKRDKHGDYTTIRGLVELTNSKKVTSQVIETLIKSGAMDSVGHERWYMLKLIEPAVIFKKKKAAKFQKNQLALFDRKLELDDFEVDRTDRPTKADRDRYETEALGFYLFDNPLRDHVELINQSTTHSIYQVKNNEVSKEDKNSVVVAGYIGSVKKLKRRSDGAPMAFLELSDGLNTVEICIFTREYKKLEHVAVKNELVMFQGQFKESEEGGQVVAKGATLLDSLPKLKDDEGFFYFTTESGHKILLEAKEKIGFLHKLTQTFNNCTEGRK